MFSARLNSCDQGNQQADDALAIWSAGTARVLPRNVIPSSLEVADDGLIIAGRLFLTAQFSQVCVFGAGKAGAAMAVEVERALRDSCYWDRLRGRVNVPDDRRGLPHTDKMKLQVARPAGYNFPTPEGESATRRMLEDLASLDRESIALGLISGGGSALLVCPRDGMTLAHLLAVTQFLQAAGATIHELNGVRSWLCQVKAGGLARLCNAGRIETLIISDVVGDDLGVIASGPCQASDVTAEQAYEILKHVIDNANVEVRREIAESLEYIGNLARTREVHSPLGDHVRNNLIATNAVALDAARLKAEELGYRVLMRGSTNQGNAYDGGREFANLCQELQDRGGRWCVISGGEPTLVLNPQRPAGCRGGRNQAWALAALDELWRVCGRELQDIAILAGGTDGEDGPCDVAGAIATQDVLIAACERGLDPMSYLENNNEYAFFEQTGGHLDTGGGTNTNVCDIRVACIGLGPLDQLTKK